MGLISILPHFMIGRKLWTLSLRKQRNGSPWLRRLTRHAARRISKFEKRGELRRLAATKNKQLNSSGSSKDEPETLQMDLKPRVVWRGTFILNQNHLR